jgi:hypothetical protein
MHIESPDLDLQTVARADGLWTAMAEYERGELSLERLCWELLHRLVPVAHEAWARGLSARWSQLEAINDRVLTDRCHQLTPAERAEVARLLGEVRALLVEG